MNLNVFKRGYLPKSYIPNWFHNGKQFLRNIKYAYQRITKGYCDYDIWQLDYFYLQLFYETLNRLAEQSISIPYSFMNKQEKWEDYLKEMAEHFKNALEDTPNEYSEKADILFENFPDFNREEWLELLNKDALYREDEKSLGLSMLSEYFFELWD